MAPHRKAQLLPLSDDGRVADPPRAQRLNICLLSSHQRRPARGLRFRIFGSVACSAVAHVHVQHVVAGVGPDDRKVAAGIFEVSKEMPRTLLAILQVRDPQGCKPQTNARGGVQAN